MKRGRKPTFSTPWPPRRRYRGIMGAMLTDEADLSPGGSDLEIQTPNPPVSDLEIPTTNPPSQIWRFRHPTLQSQIWRFRLRPRRSQNCPSVRAKARPHPQGLRSLLVTIPARGSNFDRGDSPNGLTGACRGPPRRGSLPPVPAWKIWTLKKSYRRKRKRKRRRTHGASIDEDAAGGGESSGDTCMFLQFGDF